MAVSRSAVALSFAAAEAIYGSTCVYGVYTPCQHNLLIKMTSRVQPSALRLRSGGQILISCMICWRFPCCVPGRGSGAQRRSELGQIELHHLIGLSRASLGPCQKDGDCLKWREGEAFGRWKTQAQEQKARNKTPGLGTDVGSGVLLGLPGNAAQLGSRALLCSAPEWCSSS